MFYYLFVLLTVVPATLGKYVAPPGMLLPGWDATEEIEEEVPCDSCCEAPKPADACDTMFERLVVVNEAIREGGCSTGISP